MVDVVADAYFPLAVPEVAVLEHANIHQVKDTLISGGHASSQEVDTYLALVDSGGLDLATAPLVSAWADAHRHPIVERRPNPTHLARYSGHHQLVASHLGRGTLAIVAVMPSTPQPLPFSWRRSTVVSLVAPLRRGVTIDAHSTLGLWGSGPPPGGHPACPPDVRLAHDSHQE